jgi:hypothetical protein
MIQAIIINIRIFLKLRKFKSEIIPMKLKLHQFLIFLCCFFATEYSALAQFSDFPEPEWINEILFVNHHDKKLQELERKEAINDLRQSAGMQLGIVVNVKN